MKNLSMKLKELVRSEEGATGVEYGIMVAAIAAVIVTLVYSIGDRVEEAFTTINTAMGG